MNSSVTARPLLLLLLFLWIQVLQLDHYYCGYSITYANTITTTDTTYVSTNDTSNDITAAATTSVNTIDYTNEFPDTNDNLFHDTNDNLFESIPESTTEEKHKNVQSIAARRTESLMQLEQTKLL